MSLLATVVDTKALRDVIVAGFAFGIGVTAIFGLVIYGTARADDLRRQGNGVGAALFGAFAGLAFAAFAGVVVLGIVVMFKK